MPVETLAWAVAGALAALAGATGCADDAQGPDGVENTPALCTNGIDDDLNGWTDCLDINCVTLLVCVHPDAGDVAEDGGDDVAQDVEADGASDACTEPCAVSLDTECLPSDRIRRCEHACWAYYSCWSICADIGAVYTGTCERGCGGAADDVCCCG